MAVDRRIRQFTQKVNIYAIGKLEFFVQLLAEEGLGAGDEMAQRRGLLRQKGRNGKKRWRSLALF